MCYLRDAKRETGNMNRISTAEEMACEIYASNLDEQQESSLSDKAGFHILEFQQEETAEQLLAQYYRDQNMMPVVI